MGKRTWTDAEDAALRRWYGRMPRAEVAQRLGRSVPSVSGRALALGLRQKKEPRWSAPEIAHLRENFGVRSCITIARQLGRSAAGVKLKAKRLGLRARSRKLLTPRRIARLLHICGKQVKRWIEQGWLPARRYTTRRGPYHLVSPEDLVACLRTHPELWDARRCPDLHLTLGLRAARPVDIMAALGRDEAHGLLGRQDRPIWLRDKLAADIARGRARQRWTPAEDAKLRDLFRRGVTYAEIGRRLGRSAEAINHRVQRLGKRIWSNAS